VAFDRAFTHTAHAAQGILCRRWPTAEVRVVDQTPADAILTIARRRHAKAIVLGSRHRNWIARRLLGSVSAAVLRHALCPVLVVRGRPRAFDRVVIGVDGSRHSQHAVEFVGRLPVPKPKTATLVRVVEPIRMPSTPFMFGTGRAMLIRQAKRMNAAAARPARAELTRHARHLRRSGWRVQSAIVWGTPVPQLLSTASRARAHLLVIGARGVGGVKRLLLGSVAEGVLDRAPMSILLVR
jgi:nucleotide-binding universal stress UspA family protein